MRLINHLHPAPIHGSRHLDVAQFHYFKLIIISCQTDLQCCTAQNWIQRLAGRSIQYLDLQKLIDERRAEIAGKGQYFTQNPN